MEHFIVRAINHAHAALPYLGNDAVAAKRFADHV
jgi:hypothetical protein